MLAMFLLVMQELTFDSSKGMNNISLIHLILKKHAEHEQCLHIANNIQEDRPFIARCIYIKHTLQIENSALNMLIQLNLTIFNEFREEGGFLPG